MAHRFILLGRNTFFAYHLGLFYVPEHAYQMILHVDLDATAGQAYLTDLATPVPAGKKRYYSLQTQDPFFPLSDIDNGTRTSFGAVVERVLADATTGDRTFTALTDSSGNPVTATVTIPSGGKLYFAPIGKTEFPAHCTGLLFGTTGETYLAHRLAKPDHWDEVLTVTVSPPPSQTDLDAVQILTVPTLPDTLTGELAQQHSPFTAGAQYKGELAPRSGGTGHEVTFTAGAQNWWNSTSLNKK